MGIPAVHGTRGSRLRRPRQRIPVTHHDASRRAPAWCSERVVRRNPRARASPFHGRTRSPAARPRRRAPQTSEAPRPGVSHGASLRRAETARTPTRRPPATCRVRGPTLSRPCGLPPRCARALPMSRPHRGRQVTRRRLSRRGAACAAAHRRAPPRPRRSRQMAPRIRPS